MTAERVAEIQRRGRELLVESGPLDGDETETELEAFDVGVMVGLVLASDLLSIPVADIMQRVKP